MLRRQAQIINKYQKIAPQYSRHSPVPQEVGKRLLERLEYMQFSPKRILDLGAGTLHLTGQLHTRFPHAHVCACDVSIAMLVQGRQEQALPISVVCTDMHRLALKENAFDFIVCNATLPFAHSLETVFRECLRLLTPKGLLLFTTAGPNTLKSFSLPFTWPDMHTVGDLLLHLGFCDPMMDAETLYMTYNQINSFITDIAALGSPVPKVFKRPIVAEFEVIYGMAWGPEKPPKSIPIFTL